MQTTLHTITLLLLLSMHCAPMENAFWSTISQLLGVWCVFRTSIVSRWLKMEIQAAGSLYLLVWFSEDASSEENKEIL